jgi:hypothetical protein
VKKSALLLILLPLLCFAESIEIAGHRLEVLIPEGWQLINETTDDYFFVWATPEEELIGLINLYKGESLEMTTDDILEQYDGDKAAMLADLKDSLVTAVEETSAAHELEWGSRDATGVDPAYFASVDYYDTWEESTYYNLDSLFLYAGQIFYLDAFCAAEEEEAFRENVLAFIDELHFH